ncbi:hypothetical protein GCM10010172_81770 [Paractinoplanes ferrugineus]|uniref:CopC domain-containing protein n=1 Tax=Paractinoplanes ferrugineus TaxID=113564 RepID=A0A919J051_9ACTN|nr:copper resistance protein CopC [Actinoplanes ferrugineus]GIE10498.1 hypothetical protein Afe05nite_23380 [Actinoplanes ferrugineus]
MDHPDRFRRALLAATAILVVWLPAAPASAHTELVSTTPAKGATVAKAPAGVELKFSQSPNSDFTQIVVSDAARKPVPASRPVVDKGTARISFPGPLANGVFTVAYRVVSNDGHTVKGNYTFTVADPAAESAPTAATPGPIDTAPTDTAPTDSAASAGGTGAAVPAADSADDAGGMPAGVLIGVGGLIAAAAAGGVLLALRRRRSAA